MSVYDESKRSREGVTGESYLHKDIENNYTGTELNKLRDFCMGTTGYFTGSDVSGIN